MKPKLYIKRGCPWCTDALSFFSKHNIELDIRDVNIDSEDREQLLELSGQSLTPTFEYKSHVIADFDISEFMAAIDKIPEIKKELGL